MDTAMKSAGVRIPADLEDEARAKAGLQDADLGVLVRAGLALLAGYGLAEAVKRASQTGRPGRKPRTSSR